MKDSVFTFLTLTISSVLPFYFIRNIFGKTSVFNLKQNLPLEKRLTADTDIEFSNLTPVLYFFQRSSFVNYIIFRNSY